MCPSSDEIDGSDVMRPARAAAASVTGQPRPSLTIGILLCPGFPLMSLSCIVESLRHAGDIGDRSRPIHCRWDILGDPGSRIASSCGISFRPTRAYPEPDTFDYVFLIGGLLPRMEEIPDRHRRYLRAAHASGTTVAGLCTGVFVLAQERLLTDRTACLHPYHRDDFLRAFPGIRVTTHEDFSERDGVITAPGGLSNLGLMTALIQRHLGQDRATKTVHQLTLPERAGSSEFDKALLNPHVQVSDPRIQMALLMAEADSGAALGVGEIARRLGLSERHFSRLFAQQVGLPPKTWLLRQKLEEAMRLLTGSNRSVTSVAYATGFSSCAHFSQAFHKHFGTYPSKLRGKAPQQTVHVRTI